MYTLDLEKLTDEQLKAFKVIDEKAFEAETKRRLESTYSDEDIRANKIYSDLYKAYFYIKPMYDNMRNTDVKKIITQSGILTVMEKVFRWADNHNFKYEKFKGEPVKTKEEAIAVTVSVPIEVGEPEVKEVTQEPTWEPGGGAEVEQPIYPPVEPVQEAAPAVNVPEQPAEENLSPIESMTQQKLNEILATIPAVEKI